MDEEARDLAELMASAIEADEVFAEHCASLAALFGDDAGLANALAAAGRHHRVQALMMQARLAGLQAYADRSGEGPRSPN